MQNWQIFQARFSCFAVISQVANYKSSQNTCHIALDTVRYLNKRISVKKNNPIKRNSESHISQNVNGMSLSIGFV